jgi:hypothetical protein
MSFKPLRAALGFRSRFDGFKDGVVDGRRDLEASS